MDEPLTRLCRLVDDGWSRVCIGSTGEYAQLLTENWERRMDSAWDQITQVFNRTPAIHMLRGMQCAGKRWPFASLDSTDIGQNHHRTQNTPEAMANRWDATQCPPAWIPRSGHQYDLDL